MSVCYGLWFVTSCEIVLMVLLVRLNENAAGKELEGNGMLSYNAIEDSVSLEHYPTIQEQARGDRGVRT